MAQVVTRSEVLSSYRYLLRSISIAFRGDNATLLAAKNEARKRFNLGRDMAAESSEAVEAVNEARSVGKFLRQNIVQGIKDEESEIYSMSLFYSLAYKKDYEYMTKLNVVIIRQSRIHCRYLLPNGN
jgi:hypothetical protein